MAGFAGAQLRQFPFKFVRSFPRPELPQTRPISAMHHFAQADV